MLAIPAAVAAIGVVAVFVFIIQNTAGNIKATNEEIEANKFYIAKMQSEKQQLLEDIDDLEGEIANLEIINDSFTIAYETISLSSDGVNNDMNAVVDNVISGTELRSVVHGGSVINITGISPTEEEILEYARNLDETHRFDEIVVSNIRVNEEDQTQVYNLTLLLEGTD